MLPGITEAKHLHIPEPLKKELTGGPGGRRTPFWSKDKEGTETGEGEVKDIWEKFEVSNQVQAWPNINLYKSEVLGNTSHCKLE